MARMHEAASLRRFDDHLRPCDSAPMLPLVLPHRLLLVRHGETDWNREGRLQGSQDIPLNALGRKQAAEAAERLLGLGLDLGALDFVASPMQRACETMRLMRRGLGLPEDGFRIDQRLRELTFGEWEGLTWDEVRKKSWVKADARERDKWGYVPPGGESYAMLAERLRPCVSELMRETVVVSHGGVARGLLALAGAVTPDRAALIDIWQGKILALANGEAHWI